LNPTVVVLSGPATDWREELSALMSHEFKPTAPQIDLIFRIAAYELA
jgi:hypothetical protein